MWHILIDANSISHGPIVVSCSGDRAGTVCDAFDPGGGRKVIHQRDPVDRWAKWDGKKFVPGEPPAPTPEPPTDKERIAALEAKIDALTKGV